MVRFARELAPPRRRDSARGLPSAGRAAADARIGGPRPSWTARGPGRCFPLERGERQTIGLEAAYWRKLRPLAFALRLPLARPETRGAIAGHFVPAVSDPCGPPPPVSWQEVAALLWGLSHARSGETERQSSGPALLEVKEPARRRYESHTQEREFCRLSKSRASSGNFPH